MGKVFARQIVEGSETWFVFEGEEVDVDIAVQALIDGDPLNDVLVEVFSVGQIEEYIENLTALLLATPTKV